MFLGVFNMVAFERIKSGIPQLDETLDNIRIGDNVVWQDSNLVINKDKLSRKTSHVFTTWLVFCWI